MGENTDNFGGGNFGSGKAAAAQEPSPEAAFDAWFAREVLPLEGVLMQFLSRNWRDRNELEDICQDIFVKVYLAAQREKPRAIKPFVFTVARNLLVDRVRHAQIIPIESALDFDVLNVAADEPGPERTIIARDELQHLRAAIDRLPRRCREAVMLRKIEGLTMREIAARMGIAVKTVDAHLVEGAAALADILYAETGETRRKP